LQSGALFMTMRSMSGGQVGPVSPEEADRLIGIARSQRQLLWCLLGLICLNIIAQQGAIPARAALLLLLAGSVVSFVFVVRLGALLFGSVGAAFVGAVLLAPPITLFLDPPIGVLLSVLNLLMLVVVNGRATRALKANGIHVGFMGAAEQEVRSVLARQVVPPARVLNQPGER
jgi:hypothetical protein